MAKSGHPIVAEMGLWEIRGEREGDKRYEIEEPSYSKREKS